MKSLLKEFMKVFFPLVNIHYFLQRECQKQFSNIIIGKSKLKNMDA